MLKHPGSSKNGKPLLPLDIDNSRNIVKQFILKCNKSATSFQSLEFRIFNLAAFISILTTCMYLMVVTSDPLITSAATLIDICNARTHFKKLERVVGPRHSLLMHWILPNTLSENCLFLHLLKIYIHNVMCLKVSFEPCAAYFHVGSYMGLSEPNRELESPNRGHQTEVVVIERHSCC